MKHKFFNLQLFDDGGQGGIGDGAGTAGNGNGSQGNAGAGGGYSFQQAEEIANARAERAEKAALSSYFKQQGMSEDEITQAIKDFKVKKDSQKPNVDAVTKERDQARAELAAMKNAQTLRAKGVRDEDADYVLFKVNALMQADDKLDFDKAAAKFLKDNPRFTTAGSGGYRVKTGTDGSQGAGGTDSNAAINNAIRAAARH